MTDHLQFGYVPLWDGKSIKVSAVVGNKVLDVGSLQRPARAKQRNEWLDTFIAEAEKKVPFLDPEEAKRTADNLRRTILDMASEGPPESKKAAAETVAVAVVDPDPEPWDGPVDGAELLDEIVDTLRRYVVMPDHAAEILALWCLHTFTFATFRYSPRLLLTSPDKRCGKSRLLRIIAAMVARALAAEGVTTSVLFRSIEKFRPTLLLDEADTYLRGRDVSEELRGVLNAGHMRGGRVVRCIGDNHEPAAFSVFAPVALAMIGRPPGTIEDRSIVVPMRRRARGEVIERLRPGCSIRSLLEPVRRRCLRWADDHNEALGETDPTMPDELDDRAGDNWLPMLAIADDVGGHWPETARRAAVASASSRAEGDADSAGVMLLDDLRSLFRIRDVDRLATEDLLRGLHQMDERPWPEFGRSGKPITSRGVARLLRPYGVRPTTVRAAGAVAKGYKSEDLAEAWDRYTPPAEALPVTDAPEVLFPPRRNGVTDGREEEVPHVTGNGSVLDEQELGF